jgi:LysM repeat protein
LRASRALKAALYSAAAGITTAGLTLLLSGVASASTHVVQPGDTLWAITGGNTSEINEIAVLNHLSDPNLILVGQVLQIPDGTPAQTVSVSAPAPAPAAPAPVVSAPSGSFKACVAFRESTDGLLSSNIYGFLQSTWSSLGLGGSPYTASPGLQSQAFDMLYARDGTAPWAPYDGC